MSTRFRAFRNVVLLFFACLFLHAIGTWRLPLIDRDEPRFAEASREMMERHDYIVPTFNNQYRLDKPPLLYWMQIASFRLFGESDFAARFPSMVAAALTSVLLLIWGTRIASESVGWWAAIVFTLCLQVLLAGKTALPEMSLVLFVTLANWAAFELLFEPSNRSPVSGPRSRKYWLVIFYVALALGFLTKGPIGWTPLLTLACTKLLLREESLRRRFHLVIGMVLVIVIIALWAVPALLQTNGAYFSEGIGRHVFKRAIGPAGPSNLIVYLLTLPFYFVAVFVSFFPWSIKLPKVVQRVWANRDKIDNYLVAAIAPIFLILTLIYTKFPRYTLPAFPLLALLLARHLFGSRRSFQFVTRVAAIVGVLYLGTVVFVNPALARATPSYQLFRQAASDLKPEMEFAAVDFPQPSLIWYFRSRVHGWFQNLNSTKVAAFMDSPGARFVVLRTQTAHDLYPITPSEWKTFRASGVLLPTGEHVDLTLMLKP